MRRRPLALALALVLASVAHAAAQQYFPSDSDLEVMLRYIVEDGVSPAIVATGVSPGIVLGVVDADGHSRFVSYGDVASPASYATGAAHPLGAQSVFEIGSVGKAFTGVLLAEMAGTGEVSLDDPVAKYLPDSVRVPSRGGREITLLDLATHFSGLPFGPDNLKPANPADPWADYTSEKLYSFLSSYQLPREPGERFEYSNVGAALLGLALARAAGTDFTSLLRQRILDPLEGTYDLKINDNAQEMRVYTYENHAYAQIRGRFATPLRNLGGGIFVPESNQRLRFVFTVANDGTVRIAVLSNGRATWTGTRRAKH